MNDRPSITGRPETPESGSEVCRLAQIWLDRDLDGRLEDADRARLEEHLEDCDDCRDLGTDLRRLGRAVAELPRAVEPSRDLWPAIASRLAPRSEDERLSADRLAASAPRASRRPVPWSWQAIAALLLLALGAWLGRLGPAVLEPAAVEGAAGPALEAVPATFVSPAASLERIEVDYLRAKESLWLDLAARQDELPPGTLELVSRNLRILQQATRELRRALEIEPGNPRLETLLLAQHRREIDLLQQIVRTAAEG